VEAFKTAEAKRMTILIDALNMMKYLTKTIDPLSWSEKLAGVLPRKAHCHHASLFFALLPRGLQGFSQR
jgi:hypothetical protein